MMRTLNVTHKTFNFLTVVDLNSVRIDTTAVNKHAISFKNKGIA